MKNKAALTFWIVYILIVAFVIYITQMTLLEVIGVFVIAAILNAIFIWFDSFRNRG